MKRTSIFLFFCLLLSLNACAFAPVNRPRVDPYLSMAHGVYANLPADKAKDIVKKAIESEGYQVYHEAKRPDGWLVTTMIRPMPIGEYFCNCGDWNGTKLTGLADSRITVTIEQTASGASNVAVSYTYEGLFTGRNIYGMITRQEKVPCQSSGTQERQFIDLLDALVRDLR